MVRIIRARRMPKKGSVTTRYRKPKSMLSKFTSGIGKVAKIAKTVSMLKTMINAEKKRTNYPLIQNASVGQCYNNSDLGFQVFDITPIIPSGTGTGARIGASVKLNSLHIRAQFKAQDHLFSKQKLKIEVFRVMGNYVSVPGVVKSQLYDPDSLSGCTDAFSIRNPDYFHNYKLVKSFSRTVYPMLLDPSSTTPTLQPRFADLVADIKFRHHLRYDYDSNQVTQGQVILVVRADTGNSDTGTASSIPGIANPQAGSGSEFNATFRWDYYDN